MRDLKVLVLTATVCFFFSFPGAKANAGSKNFDVFCSQLLQFDTKFSQKDYADFFDPSFIAQIPLEQLIALFAELLTDTGSCVSSSSTQQDSSDRYLLTLKTTKGFEVLLMATANQSTTLISGLRLNGVSNPAVVIKSWNDVGLAFQGLDANGSLGATLQTENGKTHLRQGSESVFAIGSTFKLYVLGALYSSIKSGDRNWDQQISIREDWKSLPSGTMQDLPAGTLVSLKELADNMISISDNTATDHLLYLLGRKSVEAMLIPMNNKHDGLNIPFLSTLEMFKLKWAVDPKETDAYIKSDVPTKLKILDYLKHVPRSAVGSNGVSFERPTEIATLEWFGTTDDTCEAILWIGKQNDSNLNQILSKNVPMVDLSQDSHWNYAGFKGGSEPGVINMTFLLESKKGNRACLSMSWNNSSRAVSTPLFMDVVKKTLVFAESLVP